MPIPVEPVLARGVLGEVVLGEDVLSDVVLTHPSGAVLGKAVLGEAVLGEAVPGEVVLGTGDLVEVVLSKAFLAHPGHHLVSICNYNRGLHFYLDFCPRSIHNSTFVIVLLLDSNKYHL